jgi:hypothetical protein
MKKAFILVGVAMLLFFAITGVVLAATPQDIYNDYAKNGHLTGTYTDQELQAYLNDAAIHQYGNPTVVDDLDQLVKGMLSRSEFPFTGAQLALIAVIAVVLIAGGFALRRLTRKRA